MAKKSIVIFEDKKDEREKLEKEFKKVFYGSINIYFFESEAKSENEQITYEEKIKRDLDAAKLGDIELIVTDRDLSSTENYIGLSEVAVTNVADEKAIPVCLYSRGTSDEKLKDLFKQTIRWQDYKIILDFENHKKIALQSEVFYKGFHKIKSDYSKIIKKFPKSPSEILSKILEKPYLQDRIALYGAGDAHMLSDILPFYKNDGSPQDDIQKRVPRLLGYWLWDSIIRFPGILVNEVAAASYLNINVGDFSKKSVRMLFDKALYSGPFAGIHPLWWRDDLDNILIENNCKDGLELAKKHGIRRIQDCKCSVDSNLTAGYYCMITQKPVSAENSKSNISWFPAGADLARISNPVFDELAPWLGLY